MNCNNEHVPEQIPKVSVEGMTLLFLAIKSKMLKGIHKFREELLSKKEPIHEDKRNSQPIQILKNIKMRGFTVRKVSHGDKIKDVASHPCASTAEESIVQSIQRAL